MWGRTVASRARLWLHAIVPLMAASYAAERGRRILWLPAGLGIGIGYYFALPVEPHWSQGPIAIGLAALVMVISWRSALAPIAAMILAATIGLGAAQLRVATVAAPVLSSEIGPINLQGRILSISGKSDGAAKIVIAPTSIPRLEARLWPAKARISLKGDTSALRPGQSVRIKGVVLAPPPGPVLPGAYDFARAAWFEGIGASGYARGAPEVMGEPEALSVFDAASMAISNWRFEIASRIRKALPGTEGSIAAALIAGDRGFIPEHDMDALRDSSLAHLLSISGLHMAIVGLGLFGIVRLALALVPWLALRVSTKKWAAAIALVGTFAYLVLSGSSVPAVRSFMMIGLMFVAILVDRPAITMRTVALAGALILLVAPESLLDPSFQMSFAAVVALIAAHEELVAWRERQGPALVPPGLAMRGAIYVGGAAFTSFIAGLATAPFAAFHFARYASYGTAANVLVTPLTSFIIMPMGAAALVLMPFGLESWALEPMGWAIRQMLAIAHWVADWPGAIAATPAWPVAPLLLSVVGGLWVTIWQGTWRLLGIAPIAVAFLLSLTTRTPDIIVEADGKNIAVLGADGHYALFSNKPKFEVERWLERVGDPREASDINLAPSLTCEAGVCLSKVKRDNRTWRVAYIPRAVMAKVKCPRADVLIAYAAPPGCKGAKLTIDRNDLREGGAHVVWLDENVRAESVSASRGVRPWVVTP